MLRACDHDASVLQAASCLYFSLHFWRGICGPSMVTRDPLHRSFLVRFSQVAERAQRPHLLGAGIAAPAARLRVRRRLRARPARGAPRMARAPATTRRRRRGGRRRGDGRAPCLGAGAADAAEGAREARLPALRRRHRRRRARLRLRLMAPLLRLSASSLSPIHKRRSTLTPAYPVNVSLKKLPLPPTPVDAEIPLILVMNRLVGLVGDLRHLCRLGLARRQQ